MEDPRPPSPAPSDSTASYVDHPPTDAELRGDLLAVPGRAVLLHPVQPPSEQAARRANLARRRAVDASRERVATTGRAAAASKELSEREGGRVREIQGEVRAGEAKAAAAANTRRAASERKVRKWGGVAAYTTSGAEWSKGRGARRRMEVGGRIRVAQRRT